MEIRDKIAIVTGASSGIGLATARLLAAGGARVALVSRAKEKLEKLAAGIPGSFAAPADMTREQDIIRMAEAVRSRFGGIDILVNSAGQGYDAPIEKTDIGTLRHVFELDVVGPLVAMQQAIPSMRARGGGAIVNVSSGTALMTLPNMGGYSALKRALAGISLTAREELAKDGITVSVVYPYSTLTDFERNTIKNDVPVSDWNPAESGLPPADPAEHVARKIIEAIRTGEAEVFAHDWMRK